MLVKDIIHTVESFCPPEFAEVWDPVGLALGDRDWPVGRLLLALDLTSAVAVEAVGVERTMLLCYHPPIFKPLKHLAGDDPRTRSLLMLAASRSAVYSPHTALDAAPGGIGDFLAGLLRADRVEQIPRPAAEGAGQFKLVVFVPAEHADSLRSAMAMAGAGRIGHYEQCSYVLEGYGTFRGDEASNPVVGQAGRLETVAEQRLEMVVGAAHLSAAIAAVRAHHPYEEPAFDVYPLANPHMASLPGTGRVAVFDQPISLEELAGRVAKGLGIGHVEQIANSDAQPIRRVAICPGAGVSVLKQAGAVDAWLTGEMRYHDVLEAREQGLSVLLTGHAQSERPYLPVLRSKLADRLGSEIEVVVAESER